MDLSENETGRFLQFDQDFSPGGHEGYGKKPECEIQHPKAGWTFGRFAQP
jgi:hypothetical protein